MPKPRVVPAGVPSRTPEVIVGFCGSNGMPFLLQVIALRKRSVDPERIEKVVSKIVREMESQGENEVSSETIGELVMEHLRELDDVAYVRFASVYRNFREAKDFRAALDELSGDEKPGTPPRK